MESIKKIAAFAALCLIVVGAVSSLIIIGQSRQWVAFAGELLVIAGAVPTIVRLVRYLLGDAGA